MNTSHPVIKTNSGSVKGTSKKNDVGKLYYSFYHIPYAQQPTADLRFKDPKPVEPWNEILDCTKEIALKSCYRIETLETGKPEFIGSDDCLGLSVFTPNVSQSYVFVSEKLHKVL